jgi:hypothetical protein
MPQGYSHPGTRVAIEAIERNLSSLEDARSRGVETDPDRAEELLPWVGQALFWIVAVDDLLVGTYKGWSYRQFRDGDPDGRYLDGARLARNAVAHGVVILHSFQNGMTFPIAFPLTFGEVRWSSLNDVLTICQRNFFDARPEEPLRAAQRWLLAAPGRGWTL